MLRLLCLLSQLKADIESHPNNGISQALMLQGKKPWWQKENLRWKDSKAERSLGVPELSFLDVQRPHLLQLYKQATNKGHLIKTFAQLTLPP